MRVTFEHVIDDQAERSRVDEWPKDGEAARLRLMKDLAKIGPRRNTGMARTVSGLGLDLPKNYQKSFEEKADKFVEREETQRRREAIA